MSPKLEKLFVKTARNVAKCSTCSRVQVGAVLVKDGRIIATGWNGVPAGNKHCTEIFDVDIEWTEAQSIEHHDFAVNNELHSEQNLIAFCARNGLSTDNTTLYVTTSPCSQCAKLILAAGIKEVWYIDEYDRDFQGVLFLRNNGVNAEQIKGVL